MLASLNRNAYNSDYMKSLKEYFPFFFWDSLFGIISFSISHYSQLFHYVRVTAWSAFEKEVSLGFKTVLAARRWWLHEVRWSNIFVLKSQCRLAVTCDSDHKESRGALLPAREHMASSILHPGIPRGKLKWMKMPFHVHLTVCLLQHCTLNGQPGGFHDDYPTPSACFWLVKGLVCRSAGPLVTRSTLAGFWPPTKSLPPHLLPGRAGRDGLVQGVMNPAEQQVFSLVAFLSFSGFHSGLPVTPLTWLKLIQSKNSLNSDKNWARASEYFHEIHSQ